jgi:hypothetical protein
MSMPVKRFNNNNINKQQINEKIRSNHWLINDESIENIETNKPLNELNNSEDNDYKGYKSSLNDSVVDDLVSTLTNKLCLKTKICKHNRMSPYRINNSAINKSQTNTPLCLNCKFLINGNHNNSKERTQTSISDTYELMQELLKEGSLIKEAVKRLQFKSEDTKKFDYYDYSDDENEINLLNS